MRNLKRLGLVLTATVVVTSCIGLGTASGTVLCATNTTPCASKLGVGTKIAATLKTGTKWILKAGFATVEASESAFSGTTVTPGGLTETVSVPLSSTTITSSGGCTVTVIKPGELEFHYVLGLLWKITKKNFEYKVSCLGVECTYGGVAGENTSGESGSPAVLKAVEVPVSKVAGGILCANPAKWTAQYTLTSPSTLYVKAE
jgi:hypothetical protein